MLSVFTKAFRDTRRSVFWLSVGLAIYGVLVVSFYPSILEQQDQLQELIDSYPREFLAMFYGDSEEIDIADAGGFVHSQYSIFMLLIVGATVIEQSFRSIINAERDGSMDMILSLPISRRELLLGRFLNSALTIFCVLTASTIAFWLGTQIFPEFAIPADRLAIGFYGAFLPLMVLVAFVYLLNAWVPSSRRFAGSLAYLFLIGTYLIYSFALIVKGLEAIKPFTIYHYYNTRILINEGLDLGNSALLLGVVLALYALAWWRIDQKEIGV